MNMTQGFREDARAHGDGSGGLSALQQRVKRAKDDLALHHHIIQQQAGIQQQPGIEEKDQPSNGRVVLNEWADLDREWCEPTDWNARMLQAWHQMHGELLQQRHQAQLQQQHASGQEQRLPASLADQQAERYQRPLTPPDMQRQNTRIRSHMARRSSHSLNSEPEHSDKPSGPVDVGSYTQPFLSFISENPTIFHAVASVAERLKSHGFIKLSERDSWTGRLARRGKYFFERNGSSLIAFVVGEGYKSGNGASVIATHIDALATRLKPIPTLSSKAGYVQLGVAPYAGALNSTWWDRDLGIGGRVLVKDSKNGKIQTKLVKLGWPIARIPTLAPHFGAAANLSNANKETEMVPIIGLDSTDSSRGESSAPQESSVLGGAGTFTATQPERLVKAIAGEMNIQDCKNLTFPTISIADNMQTVQSSTGSSSFSTRNLHNSVVSTKNSFSLVGWTTSYALSLPSKLSLPPAKTPAPIPVRSKLWAASMMKRLGHYCAKVLTVTSYQVPSSAYVKLSQKRAAERTQCRKCTPTASSSVPMSPML